ncbi:TPA: MFS transporter, partial [Patescibacteria group bacterium]|nr:MFS transporter [Patescibacteria group bacterium]
MIFPILPIFLKNVLGAPFIVIGLIEGVAEGLGSILKYFSGYLSDKIRKRKGLTIIGYALSASSKFIFAIANSSLIVLAARTLDRTGKGIRTAPRDALIAESVDPKERGKYFGIHRASDTAGAVLGTLIAIVILYLLENNISGTLRMILFISFIPASLSVLLLLPVKEVASTRSKQFKDHKLFDFGTLSPRFKKVLIVASLFGLANYSYAFYILRADDIGIMLFLIPVVYLIYNIFYAASVYPAGKLSDKIGRKPLLLSAFVLFALVNLGFAFVINDITVWVLFALYGLFIGLTDGVFKAFISDLAVREHRGEAFGIYHTTIGLATLGGNVLGGLVWQLFGAIWPFILSSVWILIAAFVLLTKVQPVAQKKEAFTADKFRGYRA